MRRALIIDALFSMVATAIATRSLGKVALTEVNGCPLVLAIEFGVDVVAVNLGYDGATRVDVELVPVV